MSLNTNYLIPNYKPKDLIVGKGSGCYLFSKSGKKYLDFTGGIGVNCLGHAPKEVLQAITKQAAKVVHTSNMFMISEQAELAKNISLSIDKKTKYYGYFSNSGAESIEAAIKLARMYAYTNKRKANILTFKSSFHGRTLATIYACNNKRHVEGFAPKVSGFSQLALSHFFEDKSETDKTLKTIKEKLSTKNYCAIMLEPIQGEGGIRVFSKYFLDELYKICGKHKVLIILDEVQCGNSRSGKTWAHQYSNLKPDILATAKGLGGGFPIGATFAVEKVAKHLTPGTHGSTFGGNPLAIAAGLAVFSKITKAEFQKNINASSKLIIDGLNKIGRSFAKPNPISCIRGRGLMIGVYFNPDVIDHNLLISDLFERKFLVATSQFNSIRLLPPLNAGKAEIKLALDTLEQSLKKFINK